MDTPHPPPSFYRVQHDKSFTVLDEEGFAAQGHYTTSYHHWITPLKFHEHLDCKIRPLRCTPFISVFDNKEDALKRARHHMYREDKGVMLAEIDTYRLSQSVLEIESDTGTPIRLPVWKDPGACVFISTVELRRHIGVDTSISQESEWFAIEEIPASMIRRLTHFN